MKKIKYIFTYYMPSRWFKNSYKSRPPSFFTDHERKPTSEIVTDKNILYSNMYGWNIKDLFVASEAKSYQEGSCLSSLRPDTRLNHNSPPDNAAPLEHNAVT